MIRTQIQLHQEQAKWLKKFALEKGISMAQAIRDSIDAYRLTNQKSRITVSKKEKALKAVGRFETKHNYETFEKNIR